MNLQEIYISIKKDYCSLFSFKLHGGSIEIITPVSTITNNFVSVFLTVKENEYIVTDGGWIDENYYQAELNTNESDIINNTIGQYSNFYNISVTRTKDNRSFYYRKVTDLNLVSKLVFDLSNFIANAINASALSYRPQKEKEERDKFRSNMNEFLKDTYKDSFKKGYDLVGLKFGGVIRFRNKVHTIEYITGSSKKYFQNDLRKSLVNFQLLHRTNLKNHLGEKLAFMNDNSKGFEEGKAPLIIGLLKEQLTKDPLTWSSRKNILKIIPS